MKDLTQGQQLVVEQLVAELTNLNESQYNKHEIDRRITLAREDAQDLFKRIKEQLGESVVAQELSAIASNIDIALDLNDNESDNWLTKEQYESNESWATSRRGAVASKWVTESDIELDFSALGSQKDGYNLQCFDGFARGDNGVVQVELRYPKFSDLNGEELIDAFRNRYYYTPVSESDVHFGDIMMKMSKLESFRLL